jgi:glycosyltransferase involved in cell wall biosynthesis
MKVSVVMAAYNAERYIAEAIESILSQTFEDFEFLIVNDGSTDGTEDILEKCKDPRIKVIHQLNTGCASARDLAIAQASGEYIAIMDADDISLPERLEKTVNYLDSHPKTVLVGTGFIARDDDSKLERVFFHPQDDEEIRCVMLIDSPFLDPSILMRTEAYRRVGGYKIDHKFDYELLSRLAKIGKLANIKEVLVVTRRHSRQFFRAGLTPDEHRKMRLKVRWLTLWRLKPPFFLFIKTLVWLCFEYMTHLIPESARHRLPESFRTFFKTNLPLEASLAVNKKIPKKTTMTKSQLPSLKQIRGSHAWKREYEKFLPLSRYFYRPIGFLLTWIGIRLGLTTEVVSWLSGILGIGGLLFLMGKSLYSVWLGIGLLVFFNLLDCVDGSIARVMKTENPYGKFLDSVLGDIINFAFFAAVGILAYRHPLLVSLNFGSEDGTPLYLAIGGMTSFFYILLSHVEQLFIYQIKNLNIDYQGNTASHVTRPSESVPGFGPNFSESTSKTILRLMDRNFRVRETHYLLLFFALLLKRVDFFLLLFFTYYLLHIILTSLVYFYRAKMMRDCELKSRVP